jgi:hypothetical protein
VNRKRGSSTPPPPPPPHSNTIFDSSAEHRDNILKRFYIAVFVKYEIDKKRGKKSRKWNWKKEGLADGTEEIVKTGSYAEDFMQKRNQFQDKG